MLSFDDIGAEAMPGLEISELAAADALLQDRGA